MSEPWEIAEVLGGEALLGHPVKSLPALGALVASGIPYRAFSSLVETINPDRSKHVEDELIRIVLASGGRRRLGALKRASRQNARLSFEESERVERLARVYALALKVAGDASEARGFLRDAHPLLDGNSPLTILSSEVGARQVEEILNAVRFGLAA